MFSLLKRSVSMLVVFIASTLALTALAQQGWLLLVKQGLFSGA